MLHKIIDCLCSRRTKLTDQQPLQFLSRVRYKFLDYNQVQHSITGTLIHYITHKTIEQPLFFLQR